MRVFITGIDGVLGTVLKDELRRCGHDVYGCGRRHSEDPKIMRADISERRQLTQVLDHFGQMVKRSVFNYSVEFDVLFHFAAEFGRKNGQDYYEDLWKTNCVGTRNVIDECIARDIHLVFASSSEAYGLSEFYNKDVEIAESVLDDNVPQFHNEYALSKYTNERQIFTAARNHGLRAVVLRFFNIYGPPERFSPYRSVVCQLVYQMLSSLPVTVNRGGYRTHLWIGDWVRTVVRTIDNFIPLLPNYEGFSWPGAGGTPDVPVFNVGGNQYESIANLYDRLKSLIPESTSSVTYITSERANSPAKRPDNRWAERWLDHNPDTDLTEGLTRTIQWMRREYGL